MGKTFRRDSFHRPKKNGRVFTKNREKWPDKKQGEHQYPSPYGPERYIPTDQQES